MGNKKNTNLNQVILEDKIMSILGYLFWLFVVIAILIVYFHFYNPKQHAIAKKASKAFNIIEKACASIYKERGYLFDENQRESEFCEELAKRTGAKNVQCFNNMDLSYNFTLDKINVEIYGLNKITKKDIETSTKEFLIDVDGKKGENTVGIDRFPVKIYSSGNMAGRLAPVNCNFKDTRDYGFEFSSLCGEIKENNYMAENFPFGFNVIQIGGDNGKSEQILHDVPFLRADCAATGGDLIADEYCENKQYYWLQACYDEYPCSVEIEVNK